MESSIFRELLQKYLSSDHWQKIRKKAFETYGRHCMVCYTDKLLHVHHLIYHAEDLRKTSVKEVRILCEYHHNKVHNLQRSGRLRYRTDDDLVVRASKIFEALANSEDRKAREFFKPIEAKPRKKRVKKDVPKKKRRKRKKEKHLLRSIYQKPRQVF